MYNIYIYIIYYIYTYIICNIYIYILVIFIVILFIKDTEHYCTRTIFSLVKFPLIPVLY